MAKKGLSNVTMRVRVGDTEVEVSGPSDYVEKKIQEFLKKASGSGAPTPLPQAGSLAETQSETKKRLSAAQFFKRSNPKTDVDRVLAAAYFLEKNEGHENFTSAEIRDLIQKAKWPPPTNANDAINKNIKKGLLMSAGDRDKKMAFVLTSDGEEFVEEMVTQRRE